MYCADKATSGKSSKSKKKKNKKGENKNIVSSVENKYNDHLNITDNSNGLLTLKNPMFYQVQDAVNDGKSGQKNQVDSGNQQASIIKGANGMVTIRSPRLNNVNGSCPSGRALPFMSLHSVGAPVPVPVPVLSELKPVVGPNTSSYNPNYKIQDNKKPFNAQEILSGLPGIEITKINKNTIKNKNECKKVFQPADVSIIPTNMTNGTSGDIYKLFYDNSDWSLGMFSYLLSDTCTLIFAFLYINV